MAEYIERDSAINAVYESFADGKSPYGALISIKAADVRPVVLCRDCKHSYDSVGGWCCSHGICVDCIVREDFFCADGKKREEI